MVGSVNIRVTISTSEINKLFFFGDLLSVRIDFYGDPSSKEKYLKEGRKGKVYHRFDVVEHYTELYKLDEDEFDRYTRRYSSFTTTVVSNLTNIYGSPKSIILCVKIITVYRY